MSFEKMKQNNSNCLLESKFSQLLFIDNLTCSEHPLEDKGKILAYIGNESFIRDFGLGFRESDVFDGTKIPVSGDVFDDGTFIWSDALFCYFRKHDIVLPDAFLDHIRKSEVYRIADNSVPEYFKNDANKITFEMFPKRMRLMEKIELLPKCPDKKALKEELMKRGYSEEEISERLTIDEDDG